MFVYPSHSSAQDAVYYYDGGFGVVDDAADATYKREVTQRIGPGVKVTRFVRGAASGKQGAEADAWVKEEQYRAKIKDGAWVIRKSAEMFLPDRVIRTFRQTGGGLYLFSDSLQGKSIIRRGTASRVMPLHLQDTVYEYYDNGRLKSLTVYDKNQMLSSESWLKDGEKYYDNLHRYVDREPEHTYGQVYFRAHILNAFKEAQIDVNKLNGYTEIGWVVMPDGSAVGFHGLGGSLSPVNEVIIKAIREMPGEWVPARLNNRPVRYHMVLPFNFMDVSDGFQNVEMVGGMLFYD